MKICARDESLISNLESDLHQQYKEVQKLSCNLELEQMVLERAKSFWEKHVLTETPPPATYESDHKILYGRSTVSKSVEAFTETCELIKKLESLKEQVEHYEAEISQIKQSIIG